MGEVMKSIDEGTPFEVADKAIEPLGLPMSPLVLLQLVGPAVALHVAETMHDAFPDRFGVSENLKAFVDGRQDRRLRVGLDGQADRRPRGRRRCGRRATSR